jgi:hypothetical protein
LKISKDLSAAVNQRSEPPHTHTQKYEQICYILKGVDRGNTVFNIIDFIISGLICTILKYFKDKSSMSIFEGPVMGIFYGSRLLQNNRLLPKSIAHEQ